MDAPHEPRTTLTRRQVADRLGISTSSVRRLEYDKLHPTFDEAGIWRFDPKEVDALDPRSVRVRAPRARQGAAADQARTLARRGRLAARVFRMFARHMTLPQIVVATKQPPEVIRELYRDWSIGLDEGEWERRQAAETAI